MLPVRGLSILSIMIFSMVMLCFLTTASVGAAEGASTRGRMEKGSQELIVCGAGEVYILDLAQMQDGKPKKVWSWKAASWPKLPFDPDGFTGTDECKPVDGGRKILITSSGVSKAGAGVVLVERATGKPLFWAVAENAHSADLLPYNRIAVATSGHEMKDPPINPSRLTIYDANVPGKELYWTDLPWGHGVVWDEQRQLLWALSSMDIRAYRLADWESDHPALEPIFSINLPEGGGHDLYAIPNSPLLTVTTYGHCWLFDKDKRSFSLHPELRETVDVKSISVNPATGQIAYVHGEGGNWWAEHIWLLQPEQIIARPGERIYKVRWNLQAQFNAKKLSGDK
jgi:hypothetical protein